MKVYSFEIERKTKNKLNALTNKIAKTKPSFVIETKNKQKHSKNITI